MATAAQRQKAYRQRKDIGLSQHRELLEELIHALDRGRCSKFADNLPEDTAERVAEMIARLRVSRLIACKISTDGKTKASHETVGSSAPAGVGPTSSGG